MGEGVRSQPVEGASPLPWGEGQGEGRDGSYMTYPSAIAGTGARDAKQYQFGPGLFRPNPLRTKYPLYG